MSDLKDACSIVLSHGLTPVNTSAYERLRAWLDATDGWPPKDWQPGDPIPEPVYEYRVVCTDGRSDHCRWLSRRDAELIARARTIGHRHEHTIERQVIGPWEAT